MDCKIKCDNFFFTQFWSPAYNYFENLYDDDDGELKEYAVYEYLWESNNDFSLADGVSLYIPSKN